MKFAVIFRGTGKRISNEEKAQYHKDVDVYWQQNAWADLQFSIQWAKRTLKEAVYKENEEFLLFCDNLKGQAHELFLQETRSLNGVVWFGIPDATDIWQPADCNFGRVVKGKITQLQELWLQQEENIDI